MTICYVLDISARTQTLVQLTEELVESLDRRAAATGVSRSAVIRELLEQGLRDDRSAAVSARITEGYRRVPQQTASDVWGDLDRWSQTNVRRNLAALRAEEGGQW